MKNVVYLDVTPYSLMSAYIRFRISSKTLSSISGNVSLYILQFVHILGGVTNERIILKLIVKI